MGGSRASPASNTSMVTKRSATHEHLGLVEIEGEASVLLEYMLDVRENLEGDGQLGFDVAIISVRHSACVLVVLVEGAAPQWCSVKQKMIITRISRGSPCCPPASGNPTVGSVSGDIIVKGEIASFR